MKKVKKTAELAALRAISIETDEIEKIVSFLKNFQKVNGGLYEIKT